MFPQHLTDEPGYARFPLGRLDPRPPGDLFVQGDGDVSHDTRVVKHEVRVNPAQSLRGIPLKLGPEAPHQSHFAMESQSWYTK